MNTISKQMNKLLKERLNDKLCKFNNVNDRSDLVALYACSYNTDFIDRSDLVALYACSYNTGFLERYELNDLSIRINELTDVSLFNCSFVSTHAKEEHDRLKQYGRRDEN